MWDNSFSNGIGIGHIYFHAEWCAYAVPLASILPKTINDRFMQSIIHVPVELELLAWWTIPLAMAMAIASASAKSIGISNASAHSDANANANADADANSV
jgi:hypothetical protein